MGNASYRYDAGEVRSPVNRTNLFIEWLFENSLYDSSGKSNHINTNTTLATYSTEVAVDKSKRSFIRTSVNTVSNVGWYKATPTKHILQESTISFFFKANLNSPRWTTGFAPVILMLSDYYDGVDFMELGFTFVGNPRTPNIYVNNGSSVINLYSASIGEFPAIFYETGKPNLADGNWHFICIRMGDNLIQIDIDDVYGEKSFSDYHIGSPTDGKVQFLHLSFPSAETTHTYFIDNFRIYSEVCSDEKVESLRLDYIKTFATTTIDLKNTLNNPNNYGTPEADNFGQSLAIYGNYCAIGAPAEDMLGYTSVGIIYIFKNGVLERTIESPYPSSAGWGRVLSIFGNYLAVGFTNDYISYGKYGSVSVYNILTGALVWKFVNTIASYGSFGYSVCLTNDKCIISSPYDDSYKGRIYIYSLVDGTLLQTILNPSSVQGSEQFGYKISAYGNQLITGTPYEPEGSYSNSGIIYVLDLTTFDFVFTIKNPNYYRTPANDLFGQGIAITKDYFIAGAGEYPNYPNMRPSGIVYIFDINNGNVIKTLTNPENTTDFFAPNIVANDKYLLVATYGRACFVFKVGGNWDYIGKIIDPNIIPGIADNIFDTIGLYDNQILFADVTEFDDAIETYYGSGKAYIFEITAHKKRIRNIRNAYIEQSEIDKTNLYLEWLFEQNYNDTSGNGYHMTHGLTYIDYKVDGAVNDSVYCLSRNSDNYAGWYQQDPAPRPHNILIDSTIAFFFKHNLNANNTDLNRTILDVYSEDDGGTFLSLRFRFQFLANCNPYITLYINGTYKYLFRDTIPTFINSSTAGIDLCDGEWHFICLRMGDDKIQFDIDDTHSESYFASLVSESVWQNYVNFYDGKSTITSEFDYFIDNFRIYSEVCSNDKVESLMLNGSTALNWKKQSKIQHLIDNRLTIKTAQLTDSIENPNSYGIPVYDTFGNWIVANNDYTVISASEYNDDIGIVYIYNTQTKALVRTIEPPNNVEYFGVITALYGTYCAITGEAEISESVWRIRVYIYDLLTGNLLYTLINYEGESINTGYGYRVEFNSSYCFVSAINTSAGGTVYIYDITDGTFVDLIENPNVNTSSISDYFGAFMAVNENYLVVGAELEDEVGYNNSGKVYIFDLTDFSLYRTIDNPNNYGTPASDYFGTSVAIKDDYCFVCASGEDTPIGTTSGSNAGIIYVFSISTGALVETILNPTVGAFSTNSGFGGYIRTSNDWLITSTNQHVFVYSLDTFELIDIFKNPEMGLYENTFYFGNCFDIVNNLLIIGAFNQESEKGLADDSGKVFLFQITDKKISPEKNPISLTYREHRDGVANYPNFTISTDVNGDLTIANNTTKGVFYLICQLDKQYIIDNHAVVEFTTKISNYATGYQYASFVSCDLPLDYKNMVYFPDGATYMYMYNEELSNYAVSTGVASATFSTTGYTFGRDMKLCDQRSANGWTTGVWYDWNYDYPYPIENLDDVISHVFQYTSWGNSGVRNQLVTISDYKIYNRITGEILYEADFTQMVAELTGTYNDYGVIYVRPESDNSWKRVNL